MSVKFTLTSIYNSNYLINHKAVNAEPRIQNQESRTKNPESRTRNSEQLT